MLALLGEGADVERGRESADCDVALVSQADISFVSLACEEAGGPHDRPRRQMVERTLERLATEEQELGSRSTR